jgi:hypothetical protein
MKRRIVRGRRTKERGLGRGAGWPFRSQMSLFQRPTIGCPCCWRKTNSRRGSAGRRGAEVLKPAPNDYLQRWPVSKRVNGSKADAGRGSIVPSGDRRRCRGRIRGGRNASRRLARNSPSLAVPSLNAEPAFRVRANMTVDVEVATFGPFDCPVAFPPFGPRSECLAPVALAPVSITA